MNPIVYSPAFIARARARRIRAIRIQRGLEFLLASLAGSFFMWLFSITIDTQSDNVFCWVVFSIAVTMFIGAVTALVSFIKVR